MITGITQNRVGGAVVVTATSSLVAPVYFFWYVDGTYVGFSSSGVRAFVVDGQALLSVLDSNDRNYDAVANAPEVYPAKRKLFFYRSFGPDIYKYGIEQQKNSGGWDRVAVIMHDNSRWQYSYITQRLDDLSFYAWRVVPMDSVGNVGAAVVIAQEFIARKPDAPNFTASVQIDGSVTFAGVS